MTSRKLEELVSALDDGDADVEELQFDPDADIELLDDLPASFPKAPDVIDDGFDGRVDQ